MEITVKTAGNVEANANPNRISQCKRKHLIFVVVVDYARHHYKNKLSILQTWDAPNAK